MSLRVGELPRVPVVGVRVRPAAVARFVGFVVAAHLAGDVGRLSHDADLGISMVWPLYGVAVLWMATGDRRTWPWDVLGLVVATVSSLVVSGGTPGEIVVAVLLAVVAGGAWVAIDAAPGPRLVGHRRRALPEPAPRPRRLPRGQCGDRAAARRAARHRPRADPAAAPGRHLAHRGPQPELDPRPRRPRTARPAPRLAGVRTRVVLARVGRAARSAGRRDAGHGPRDQRAGVGGVRARADALRLLPGPLHRLGGLPAAAARGRAVRLRARVDGLWSPR